MWWTVEYLDTQRISKLHFYAALYSDLCTDVGRGWRLSGKAQIWHSLSLRDSCGGNGACYDYGGARIDCASAFGCIENHCSHSNIAIYPVHFDGAAGETRARYSRSTSVCMQELDMYLVMWMLMYHTFSGFRTFRPFFMLFLIKLWSTLMK